MSALHATGVTMRFGQETVLGAVDLDLHPGEMLGLLGPNGSGKSTLLRTCARLLKPTAGQVSIFGQDVHTTPTAELARSVAVLPQSPPIPEGLTVHELVRTGRHPHKRAWQRLDSTDEQIVQEAIERTALARFADRDVARLSGGERQRVWLALVLAQDTPVVLLDEPTTFLDLGHQWEVLELVDDLRRERNLSVLVVLHDVNQAARFCDRVVVLDRGRVVGAGDPSQVITAELLTETFGVEAELLERDGRPVALPRGSRRRAPVQPS